MTFAYDKMPKIQKCFVTKRHMRRIVKKEMIDILRRAMESKNSIDSLGENINSDQYCTTKEVFQYENHENNIEKIAENENHNFDKEVLQNENHDDIIEDLEPLKYINDTFDKIDINAPSSFNYPGKTPKVIDDVIIIETVKQWFLEFRHLLSQNAMDKLLAILRIPIPQFPKDSRTLLQTPTSCPYKIINVFPGFYCHIGI